jgi:amino-acid N-acetyltransferase
LGTTNDINIRAASADDLPAVQTLLQSAALPLDGVTDFFPANYAVAEGGRAVVAAIGVERYGDHGLLRSAVVADSQRGTGLGSRLTNEHIEWCRQQNIQNLYLLTTTAAPFFEKLGFERVDRAEVPHEVQQAPEFASICPSTAVVMRRTCP